MSNTIKVAAGFSIGNSESIDDRLVVNTIAERNSILSYRRYIGLETIVRDGGSGTLKKYRLEDGITNTDWKDISENGVIETRDTNATASTIPLRDSNGNFQIKLAQDKIFVGNTFGNAEQRTLPYTLTGQAGKAITVKSDLSGYEYTSFPTGSLNTVTVKSGVTGLTATKTGDNVELDASYPNTLVQSGTGYQILKSISSNKLLGATIVQGSNITISETTGEIVEGIATKRLTIAATNPTWANIQSKPNWTGFMPTSTLVGQANKVLSVKTDETGYEYRAFSNVAGSNTQVMFNDNGALAGNNQFTYNKTTGEVRYGGNRIDNTNYSIFLGSGAGGAYANSYTGIIPGGCTIIGGESLYSLISSYKFNRCTTLGSKTLRGATTADYCLALGYNAGYMETNADYKFIIETNDVRNGNKDYLIEGDFSQRWVRFNGAVRKRVETILNSDVIYSGTITSYTTSQFTDNSANFTSLGLTDFEFSVVLTTGVNAGKVIAIGYNINNTTIGGGSNQTSNLVLPINGESYKLIKTKNIASEKLGTQYEINLTTDDYAFFIPPKATTGADIEFIIKSNPNNKKLYICSNGIDYIYPDNARVTSVKTPHESTLIKYTNSGLVKCTNTLDILQPIKTSTKDLVIDLYSKIYKIDVATPTTVTFNIDSSYVPILTGNSLTIELDINMTVVSAMTWPVNVTWIGGSAPTFGSIAKYRLVFRTEDAGTTWLGNLAYTY